MVEDDDMDIKSVSSEMNRDRTTISRWLHNGVLNRQTGQRVYMKFQMDGGMVVIKREWVSEFIKALQPAGPEGGALHVVRTPPATH